VLVTRIITSFAKEQPRWQFCSIEGFFTELTQLPVHVLITGLDEGKQQCPLFKLFCFSHKFVLHLINEPLEIQSN